MSDTKVNTITDIKYLVHFLAIPMGQKLLMLGPIDEKSTSKLILPKCQLTASIRDVLGIFGSHFNTKKRLGGIKTY